MRKINLGLGAFCAYKYGVNTASKKPRTRQEKVYETLCDRIFKGRYVAGERLREEALAEEFGVSRTPIREVFRMLSADGLAALEPNRGAVVTGFTADDVEEIYDIRRSLEGLAIECAAASIPLAVLQDFRKRITHLSRNANARDHAELDQAFHSMLHEHARRRRLSALLEQQYRLMQHFRHQGFRNPSQIKAAASEHLAIIDALLARDVPEAINAMNNHLQNSKRTILKLMTGTAGKG